MTLPNFLRHLAPGERLNLRDQVLALTGVSKSAWCQWVSGRTRPSPRHARHLLTAATAFQLGAVEGHQLTLAELRPLDYDDT